PNSVYVFGTEEVEGTPVIAMELIAGGTLQERVQREGPLPVGVAVDAVLQIIAGLEAAQAIGILHRDIKPANCFEDAYGTVKVGDFGLSISTDARGESHLTLPGDFLGTPAFCSPEQMRGDELNVRSDMYAVGVTLFYLLTGHTPFEGKNMVQLLANALEKPAPPPTRFRPDIPKSLSQVVLRCLEKLPSSRFATYEELRRALTPFSASAPTPATLGLRFVAEVLDHLVFMVVNLLIPMLVFGDFMYLTDPSHYKSPQWFWLASGMFVLKALYFVVLEGVWGATIGKAIVGLRVVRLNRGAPGVPRALGRFMLLTWPGLLNYVFYWYEPTEEQTLPLAYVMAACWLVFIIGMFSTVRRRNGFAAVHDLLTGTRVIQKAAYQSRMASSSVPVTDAVTTTEAMQKVGPYDVLTVLSQSGGQKWLLGYDTRLLRKVWIRETQPGAPAVAPVLRNLARPTRLRWLQGYRGEDASWDAYEAVEGTPLLALVKERHPWAKVRRWLHDLASEVDAASKDGSMPETLALDRVWITAEGGAKLLDNEAPAA
ncbi:MAG TPA: protein kinase, partial [Candidatus Saccharimonadia bacterium]|nr:protein kinase [Candidatus Saccharimonadia bacterium]